MIPTNSLSRCESNTSTSSHLEYKSKEHFIQLNTQTGETKQKYPNEWSNVNDAHLSSLIRRILNYIQQCTTIIAFLLNYFHMLICNWQQICQWKIRSVERCPAQVLTTCRTEEIFLHLFIVVYSYRSKSVV